MIVYRLPWPVAGAFFRIAFGVLMERLFLISKGPRLRCALQFLRPVFAAIEFVVLEFYINASSTINAVRIPSARQPPSVPSGRAWELPATHTLNDRQKLMLNKLLDGFTGKLTSSKWAKIAKTSQDTAIRDIQDLINR